MKKSIVLLLILSLVASFAVAPAQAKKKKKKKKNVRVERVVEINYDHPSIGVAPLGGYPVGFPEGASEIPTTLDDQYIKIEVEDSSGQKVWGFISQGDLDGNGVNDDGYAQFCGSHEDTQPLAAPGTPILGIYAYSGACDSGEPSIMTTGTIKITFSNMP